MRQSVLVNATRVLLIVGIAVEVWVAASFLIGPYGLGFDVPRLGGSVPEGVFVMHADGVLAEIPEVDTDLSWANTNEGAVDVSTGLPAVELSGPYTAVANFLNPSRLEQSTYVVIGALTPILLAVVLWILFRVVSSVGHGSPFTEANARRLWVLAGLIGLGGTAASAADGWLDSFLISRSAAAPAFQTSQVSFEIWPLLVGLVVAVVALTWNRGVVLEKDTQGLV
jgi:hypothetical protein